MRNASELARILNCERNQKSTKLTNDATDDFAHAAARYIAHGRAETRQQGRWHAPHLRLEMRTTERKSKRGFEI